MSRIEAQIYKEEDTDLIGVKVITYDDDSNRVIDEIIVLDPEDFIALQNNLDIHNHDDIYASLDSVNQEVRTITNQYISTRNYRPPSLQLEDNGDLYVNYSNGEVITHDEIIVNNTNIITYNGNFTITGILKNGNNLLSNYDVILYNLNDESEYYFEKTNNNGEVSFNLISDSFLKNYRISASGSFVDIEIQYNNYNINCKAGVIANENGNAVISGVLNNWNEPVEGQDIQLILNDEVIDTKTTNENGEILFNVIVNKTTYYKIKYILPDETFIEKEYGVQFNEIEHEHVFTMDDVQYIKPIEGGDMQFVECNPEENNGAEFYITGNNSYINLPWDNNLWEFECELNFNYRTGLVLVQDGMMYRDRGEFYIAYGDSVNYDLAIGLYTTWGWNAEVFSPLQSGISFQDDYWFFIKIIKQTENTIEVNIYNINDKETPIISRTLTSYMIGCQKNCCVGFTSWGGRKAKARNIKVKYTNFTTPVLEETYAPKLDGTEEITTIQNYSPQIDTTNNEMYIIWNFGGYLTEGFPNTKYWEVTFDVKALKKNSPQADVFICNKGVTGQRRKQSWNYELDNHIYSESDGTYSLGEWCLGAVNMSDWKTVTISKLNNKYIKISTSGVNTYNEIQYWNNSTYENICVGISSWSTNSGSKVKNIHAKTSMEERE